MHLCVESVSHTLDILGWICTLRCQVVGFPITQSHREYGASGFLLLRNTYISKWKPIVIGIPIEHSDFKASDKNVRGVSCVKCWTNIMSKYELDEWRFQYMCFVYNVCFKQTNVYIHHNITDPLFPCIIHINI